MSMGKTSVKLQKKITIFKENYNDVHKIQTSSLIVKMKLKTSMYFGLLKCHEITTKYTNL